MIHDTVIAVYRIAEPFYSNWSTWGYMHTYIHAYINTPAICHRHILHREHWRKTISSTMYCRACFFTVCTTLSLRVHLILIQAGENKEWCWDNFVNFRSMQSAESVREQLARIMRKLSLPLVRFTHYCILRGHRYSTVGVSLIQYTEFLLSLMFAVGEHWLQLSGLLPKLEEMLVGGPVNASGTPSEARTLPYSQRQPSGCHPSLFCTR